MNNPKILIIADTRSHAWCDEMEAFFNEGSDPRVRWKKAVFSDLETAGGRLAQTFSRHEPDLLVAVFSGLLHRGRILFLERVLSWGYPVLAVLEEGVVAGLLAHRKRGLVDFVSPPLRARDVLPRLRRLLGERDAGLVGRLSREAVLGQIVGKSAVFLAEIGKIPDLADCDARVLIRGETGTGKEVCARAIHYLSRRSRKPFVPVNCGALPTELLENELFGHERGAYTGAHTGQPGLVREAEGGTLFLDEIGCMPLTAQTKLLRLLQEKEYRPLGSSKTYRADIRIISATHAELEKAVVDGSFREDLYYRLDIVPLCLPPLRERIEDTPLLARHFLDKYSKNYGKPGLELIEGALRGLALYHWPGNVRELENVIERAVVLCRGNRIGEDQIHLSKLGKSCELESFKSAKNRAVNEFEVTYLQKILQISKGNITRAALAAKKNRRAFWELIRKHHINVDRFKPRPEES